MTVYLRNAVWLDPRALVPRPGHFIVDDHGVAEVDAIPGAAPALDCDGGIATRAAAIGHHHIYSALALGMPPPRDPPRNFRQILERIWWRLDRALDHAMIAASAESTAIDLLRAGVTAVIDHHASPRAAPGSLAIIADALDRAGITHLLSIELSDRDGASARAAGLEESARHLARHPGHVGLHASFTLSDELLRAAVALARAHRTGIHIHVAEAISDQDETIARHGCRVVQRLAAAGALDLDRTILAHCLHLDDDERRLVRESRAWVVQNPDSNRQNAVGTFSPRGLGDRIMLGTDGMGSDPWAALKSLFLDGQTVGGLSCSAAWERLVRVDDHLASHGLDRQADVVVFDYVPPTPLTKDNAAAHFVYGIGAQHVRHVISKGRVCVADREVKSLDVQAIRAEARRQARRLWEAMAVNP